MPRAESGKRRPVRSLACSVGAVVWGNRTLRSAELLNDDSKYLSVRRLALYMEESLYRGTQWAVFEPNDGTLWAAIRLSVGTFMADLFRPGALYDFQVHCNATTTTEQDIANALVNVLILFAPVKPAEFVVLKFRQIGQTTA